MDGFGQGRELWEIFRKVCLRVEHVRVQCTMYKSKAIEFKLCEIIKKGDIPHTNFTAYIYSRLTAGK